MVESFSPRLQTRFREIDELLAKAAPESNLAVPTYATEIYLRI